MIRATTLALLPQDMDNGGAGEAAGRELGGLISTCCPLLAGLRFMYGPVPSTLLGALGPGLTKLVLFNTVVDSTSAIVSSISHSLPSLQSLELDALRVDASGGDCDVSPLSRLSCLQSLTLSTVRVGAGLDAVLHSCKELHTLSVDVDDLTAGMFSTSVKHLQCKSVTLGDDSLLDVRACFPSIEKVALQFLWFSRSVFSSEEEVAAAARRVEQSCCVLATWPFEQGGDELVIYVPGAVSAELRMHAACSLLHALAPLRGSSLGLSTANLTLYDMPLGAGSMLGLCQVFPNLTVLMFQIMGGVVSSSALTEAVQGLPQLQEFAVCKKEGINTGTVLAACVAAKYRHSGGKLQVRLFGMKGNEKAECMSAWEAIEPFIPGCDVSLV